MTRGRPPRHGKRSDSRVSIRITQVQRSELNDAALGLGVSASELIRAAILWRLSGRRGDKDSYRVGAARRSQARASHLPKPDRRAAMYCDAKRRASAGPEALIDYVDPFVVYERDRRICQICGELVPDNELSVDHKIPLSRDGEHSYRNTQTAHRRCNSRKGARI